MKTEIINGEIFRTGSANVFADLGLPNPEELLLKAKLMSAINTEIRQRGLTQQQAAKLVGLKQPELSRIANGGGGFSTDRLIEVLRNLGCDVEINVSIAPGPVGEVRCLEGVSPLMPVTKTIGVLAAKNRLSELIESGETVTITKRGKPVATLTPIRGQAAAAVARIRQMAKTSGLTLSDEEIVELTRSSRP
jgi:prevent-host-death family protein